MGKIFGILVVVAGVWLGAHYLSEGSLPALPGASEPSPRVAPATERARDAVLRAHEEGEERRKRLLSD